VLSNLEVSGRARKEFSAVNVADKPPVPDRDLSSDSNNVGASFDLESFKRIVIQVHLVSPGGNLSAIMGIVNDEVRIAAPLDGSLSREEAKEFRRVRASRSDELVQVEAPAFDSMSEEQIDSIFERRDAVWDLGKVIAAHDLLGGKVERRMIGRESRDKALAKSIPKDFLVFLIAQRR
jgi:hypothetical protein